MMKTPNLTAVGLLAMLASISTTLAQGPGRGPGRGGGGGPGGGGGGMPADFQDKIHQLFAHPEKIRRSVDINAKGYVAKTTTSDPELAEALQIHVRQMSGRLAEGMPVRRWDPAFGEFFERYDEMEHQFTNLKKGIRAEVSAGSPEAIAAAHNHAFIILDFSSRGEAQMHQPHRTALDADGGGSERFRGGPPDARAAELAKTFGARAKEACGELVKTLGGQLKAAIESGGPEAALPVCQAAAIPLSQGVAEKFDGLTLKRVTDRLRNPANAPDKADLRALKHFRAAKGEPQLLAHLTTAADGRTLRYYQPLVVSETCLKCHGERDAMSEKLRGQLDQFYPDDKAHGYALGDLRGLIRVEQKPPVDTEE